MTRPKKILRIYEVCEIVGLSRTTIWRLSKEGKFPEPVKLSARARGWRLADVEAWIDARENYRAG